MAKKRIALSPLWDEEKKNVCMRQTYLHALRESGAVPVILPLHVPAEDAIELLDLCDGLLMTGGPDIHPSFFGEAVDPACGTICPARDSLEQAIFRHAFAKEMPILGICRGIQTINVFLGGSLYQDIPSQAPSEVTHSCEPPYDRVIHQVTLSGPIRDLLQLETLGVNSIHHQAVKALGQGLEVMARSPEGLVEALYHPGKPFLWGLQWHPEFSFQVDENSRKLIQAFVDAC